MSDDQTPINAPEKRRQPEALEDLSLAVRDNFVWPLEDQLNSLSDAGRALVACGAVAVALVLGIGAYSLLSSGADEPAPAAQVAVTAPAPETAAAKPAPEARKEPTLQGAAPVFKAPVEPDSSKVSGSQPLDDAGAGAPSAANTGNAATDTISSSPAAAAATASTSAANAAVDGPPAGPAAIAVARKFADAFVVYETGGEQSAVRTAFKATAVPEVTKALMQRPPRQPAGVEVPKAKVLNVVPAPSHDRIYPVSVSLLRVGATSELRLEMEQLKDKQWRVTNVLG
jgi:hypothetical protein